MIKKYLLIILALTFTTNVSAGSLEPNHLKQIKIVDNWSPVINFDAFKKISKELSYDKAKYYADEFDLEQCITRIKNVTPFPKNDKTHEGWFKCQGYINSITKDNINPLKEILLSWATNPKDVMLPKILKANDYNVSGYDIPSTLGTFGQLYAIWYNDFGYTESERKLIDAYFIRKLTEQNFPVIDGRKKPCNINDPLQAMRKNVDTNTCGNIRTKVALAEIMLGFRLENQALLDKGHDDIYIVLSQVNKDGIWINQAARGANNFDYYMEYLHHLSILTEIYYAQDFDFLELTLPHGAKVHNIYEHGYKLLKDHTYLSKWAKANKGSLANPYKKVAKMSREEWLKTCYSDCGYRDATSDAEWIVSHTRYVSKYQPDLTIVLGYVKGEKTSSANISVSPDRLYWGNK